MGGVFKNDDPPPAWGYSEFLDIECKGILDSIRYNGMNEEERAAELRSRILARENKNKHPLRVNQLPNDFDNWENDTESAEDNIKEIGY